MMPVLIVVSFVGGVDGDPTLMVFRRAGSATIPLLPPPRLPAAGERLTPSGLYWKRMMAGLVVSGSMATMAPFYCKWGIIILSSSFHGDVSCERWDLAASARPERLSVAFDISYFSLGRASFSFHHLINMHQSAASDLLLVGGHLIFFIRLAFGVSCDTTRWRRAGLLAIAAPTGLRPTSNLLWYARLALAQVPGLPGDCCHPPGCAHQPWEG
jgi:hypothetical protein